MIWTLDHIGSYIASHIASYIARTKLGQIATLKHFGKTSFDRLAALYSKSTRIAKRLLAHRVESGSDDLDNLGHFFGGSSGSHLQTS